MNNTGESGNICLSPHLKGNIFSSSLLTIMFAVCLDIQLELCWGWFLLCQLSGGFFFLSYIGVELCWTLSLHILQWLCFLAFSFLMWIDLCILNNCCIPRINITWSCNMILLMCSWILFARILLRIFVSMFNCDIDQ